jgi:hypothetical protein
VATGVAGVKAAGLGASDPNALPEGWEARDDGQGNTYYYSHVTHESVWDRPQPLPPQSQRSQALPAAVLPAAPAQARPRPAASARKTPRVPWGS